MYTFINFNFCLGIISITSNFNILYLIYCYFTIIIFVHSIITSNFICILILIVFQTISQRKKTLISRSSLKYF